MQMVKIKVLYIGIFFEWSGPEGALAERRNEKKCQKMLILAFQVVMVQLSRIFHTFTILFHFSPHF